jgi:orotate phosphoribosyltransferase
VFGVPRGGLRFAEALKAHVSDLSSRTLLVDDVFTTGKSIKGYIEQQLQYEPDDILVIFSRGDEGDNIKSILKIMSP